MARPIISYAPGHDLKRQLVACDPGQLQTSAALIQRNQGVLEASAFIGVDGSRALVATQVEGVLAATVDTNVFPDPPEEFSGNIAIYTSGRFRWSAVRAANPGFVFDEVAISTLRSKESLSNRSSLVLATAGSVGLKDLASSGDVYWTVFISTRMPWIVFPEALKTRPAGCGAMFTTRHP